MIIIKRIKKWFDRQKIASAFCHKRWKNDFILFRSFVCLHCNRSLNIFLLSFLLFSTPSFFFRQSIDRRHVFDSAKTCRNRILCESSSLSSCGRGDFVVSREWKQIVANKSFFFCIFLIFRSFAASNVRFECVFSSPFFCWTNNYTLLCPFRFQFFPLGTRLKCCCDQWRSFRMETNELNSLWHCNYPIEFNAEVFPLDVAPIVCRVRQFVIAKNVTSTANFNFDEQF